MIYKDFKIVPKSPTIETPLSSHELSQAYKEVKDPNCHVKVKVVSTPKKSIENAELLNLRTRVFRHFDSAGVAVNARLDDDGHPHLGVNGATHLGLARFRKPVGHLCSRLLRAEVEFVATAGRVHVVHDVVAIDEPDRVPGLERDLLFGKPLVVLVNYDLVGMGGGCQSGQGRSRDHSKKSG